MQICFRLRGGKSCLFQQCRIYYSGFTSSICNVIVINWDMLPNSDPIGWFPVACLCDWMLDRQRATKERSIGLAFIGFACCLQSR